MMIVHPIIDCHDESFNLFKTSLVNSRVIGLSVTGKNVGRDGIISWIQIDTNKQLFILDVVNLGMDIFLELKEFFENVLIIKIIHDCRFISEFLWHKFRINLTNVFDTQTADVIIYRSVNKNFLPKELKSLYECILQYLAPAQEHLLGFQTQLTNYMENVDLLFERPANEAMIKTLFNLTKYLKPLRQAQLVILLSEFYNAVDIQRAYFRDAPVSDLLRLKSYPDRIPIQFNNIAKYSDIARKKEAKNISDSEKNENSPRLNVENLPSSKKEDIEEILHILQTVDISNNIEHPKTVNCVQINGFKDVNNSLENEGIDEGLKEVIQVCMPIECKISGCENRSNMGVKKLNQLLGLSPINKNSPNGPMLNSAVIDSSLNSGVFNHCNRVDIDQFPDMNKYLTKKLKSILHIQSGNNKSLGDCSHIEQNQFCDDIISSNYSSASKSNKNSKINLCNSDSFSSSNQHLNSAIKEVQYNNECHFNDFFNLKENNSKTILKVKNDDDDESFDGTSVDIFNIDVDIKSQRQPLISNEICENMTAGMHGVSTGQYVGDNMAQCSSSFCKNNLNSCDREFLKFFPNTSTPISEYYEESQLRVDEERNSKPFEDFDSNAFCDSNLKFINYTNSSIFDDPQLNTSGHPQSEALCDKNLNALCHKMRSEEDTQSNDFSDPYSIDLRHKIACDEDMYHKIPSEEDIYHKILREEDMYHKIPLEEDLYHKMLLKENAPSTLIDRLVPINPLKSLYGYSVSDDNRKSKADESAGQYSQKNNSLMDLYEYNVGHRAAVCDGVNHYVASFSGDVPKLPKRGDIIYDKREEENSDDAITSEKLKNLRCTSDNETTVLADMTNEYDPFSDDLDINGDGANKKYLIAPMSDKLS